MAVNRAFLSTLYAIGVAALLGLHVVALVQPWGSGTAIVNSNPVIFEAYARRYCIKEFNGDKTCHSWNRASDTSLCDVDHELCDNMKNRVKNACITAVSLTAFFLVAGIILHILVGVEFFQPGETWTLYAGDASFLCALVSTFICTCIMLTGWIDFPSDTVPNFRLPETYGVNVISVPRVFDDLGTHAEAAVLTLCCVPLVLALIYGLCMSKTVRDKIGSPDGAVAPANSNQASLNAGLLPPPSYNSAEISALQEQQRQRDAQYQQEMARQQAIQQQQQQELAQLKAQIAASAAPPAAAAAAASRSVQPGTDSGLCVTCGANRRSILLLDCRHLCLCRDCYERLTDRSCPVCQEYIRDIMEVTA